MDIREKISKELHKQARRNFPKRKVTLKGINDLFQADLVEVCPYAKFNNNYKYIMTIINCFTKFAFAIPLKSKSGPEIAKALEPILVKNKMKNLQTDLGLEFYNSHVKKLTVKYNINHYSTYSHLKASIVERFNRTLKGKMWKLFTSRGNYEWLSILPEIVKNYNNTIHRTIGMKPKDVRKKHVETILDRLNGNNKIKSLPKFKVHDRVRISKYKKVFSKGYLPNWTNEVFTVYAVKPTIPPTYILQDTEGEILKGGFYEHELSLSKVGNVYLVEKILKRKGKQVLVRWLGFDQKHDSWINSKDLV